VRLRLEEKVPRRRDIAPWGAHAARVRQCQAIARRWDYSHSCQRGGGLSVGTHVSHPRKKVGLSVLRTTATTWMFEESKMAETPHKTGPAWTEFPDDAFESVEIVRTVAIEAPCRAA
jgi:hypothetical protein